MRFRRADKEGLAITREMIQAIHRYDTTRAITEAVPEFWNAPINGRRQTLLALLDVAGYNHQKLCPGRKTYPDARLAGETLPADRYDAWNQVQGLPLSSAILYDWPWIIPEKPASDIPPYTGTGQGRLTYP